MSEGTQELARRLVVGHKSDGRRVYDEAAKAELVALCGKPGASVSRLARECAVNTNQLCRWIREHKQRRQRGDVGSAVVKPQAFVALPLAAVPDAAGQGGRMNLQARLPNGVVLDLREVDLRQTAKVIAALGRIGCSALTKR